METLDIGNMIWLFCWAPLFLVLFLAAG
jgi:hypothetical protein